MTGQYLKLPDQFGWTPKFRYTYAASQLLLTTKSEYFSLVSALRWDNMKGNAHFVPKNVSFFKLGLLLKLFNQVIGNLSKAPKITVK